MELIASPLRPRQRGFVLTSLIDVIFLLLVFFMLSSQIAPYSLLTVSGGANEQGEVRNQAAARTSANDSRSVLFVVSRGHIRAGSTTIPLDQLAAALEQLQTNKAPSATLLTTKSATVQDIVTALEIFETSRFASVRLLQSPS